MAYPYTAPGYPPSSTDMTALRMKHIQSIKQMFPSVREVDKNVTYEVNTSTGSRNIILRITLGPTFPTAPPTIQVLPLLRHRLLNQQGYVLPEAHDSLRNWSVQHHLGKILQDIIAKFVQEPPSDASPYPPTGAYPPKAGSPYPPYPPTGSTYPPTSSYPPTQPTGYPATGPYPPQPSSGPYPPAASSSPQPPAYPGYALISRKSSQNSNNSFTYSSPRTQQPPPVDSRRPTPTIESLKIDLDSKTTEELNELLMNEEKFEGFFAQISAVQEEMKARNVLRETNTKLAAQNLAMAEDIDQLSRQLSAKQAEVEASKAVLDQAMQKQAVVMQALAMKLAAAAKDADKNSEEIAKRFLSGEIPMADFVQQYREARVLHHLRAAKKETMLMQR